MPKVKAQKKPTTLPEDYTNRVWIEIERAPRGVDLSPDDLQTFRYKQCERLNNLLRRLQPEGTTVGTLKGLHFWWSERHCMYCIMTSEAGTYSVMGDNGWWFNLDHLGRD